MLRTTVGAVLVLVSYAGAQQTPYPQSQARNEDQQWLMPLEQKANVILRNSLRHNWFEGLYRPAMEIDAITDLPDHTTDGNGSDMHTCCWTGCFLMGNSFRYGWAKERGTPADVDAALDLGGQMVQGLYRVSHVSPFPGMITRETVAGHGPAGEERGGSNSRNEWHQGVGKFRDYRYRANPSHHNYDHVIRGLGYWYYFLNKYNPNPTGRVKAQMDSVKLTLVDIMDYGYKQREGVVLDVDRQPTASLYRVSGRPSTSGLMATNCLKMGAWITGDPWYARKYDELVRGNMYRESRDTLRAQMGSGSSRGRMLMTDWDDTEHVIGGLWLAYQLEQDPQLKEFYQLATSTLFDTKRDHNRSFFNYIYAGVTADQAGANLAGALETLRFYPSNTFTYPIMNSIRTDIEFTTNADGQRAAAKILPFNQQPQDNSSDWKGNPYNLDRGGARAITAFAVSGEDSMAWLLADQPGTLYHSWDGGKTFAVHSFSKDAAMSAVTFAGRKTRIMVLGTNKGIFWSHTGGYENRWTQVPLGSETNAVKEVMVDPVNPNVVWAIAADGIWRSVDLGQEEVGKAWTNVSGPMPGSRDVLFKGLVYGLVPGANPTFYAVLDGRIYRRRMADPEWTMTPGDQEGYHRIPVPGQIVASAAAPNNVLALFGVTSWGSPSVSIVRSTDGGNTFESPGARARAAALAAAAGGFGRRDRTDYTGLVIDPNNPQYVYASSPRGFFRSADGGGEWQQSNTGLRIPVVQKVFAPRQIPGTIFASTPAGFVMSANRGESWQRPLLILNGRGVNRTDRGGYCYLVAYWAGRYLGVVSDADANAAPGTR